MPALQAMPTLRDRIVAYDHAMTVNEVAKLFGVSIDSIYELVRNRSTIPFFRVGTSIRFDPKLLADWFDRQ